MRGDEAIPLAHQRADCGRRGVEDRNPVLFDHLPEAPVVGIVGHAFEDHLRRAVQQRSVGDVAVPGDPADVRRAPEDVVRPVIERIVEGRRSPHAIAARGVQHTLWLAGRATRVEDEQRVFRIHRLARAIVFTGKIRVPVVAALLHRDVRPGMCDHQHALHRSIVFVDSGIDIGLEGDRLAPAQAFVGGDHELAVAIDDAAGQRLGREAAEHDRMDRAQPRAGEHRDHAFDHHRHVQRDPRALGHAHRLERIGHAHDLAMKIGVGQRADFAVGLVGLEDERSLARPVGQMPVDCIVTQVERAVGEPLDIDRVKRPFAAFGGGIDPVEPLRLLKPEPVRVGQRAGVIRLVLFCGAGRVRGLRRVDEFAHGAGSPNRVFQLANRSIRFWRPRSFDGATCAAVARGRTNQPDRRTTWRHPCAIRARPIASDPVTSAPSRVPEISGESDA